MPNIDEALREFSTDVMVKITSQIKTAPRFLMDKYYTRRQMVLGDTVDVIIKRGAGIVLSSVSPNSEHLVQKTSDSYLLKVALPRFPLENKLNASDLLAFKSIDNATALKQTLAGKIAEILSEQKNSIDTTFEFMAIGSLFGKILDGDGRELFNFTSTKDSISFDKASGSGKQTINDTLTSIDEAMSAEFGTNPGYLVLCGKEFYANINNKALAEDLFKQNLASYKGDGKDRTIIVHGVEFKPYSAKYKDMKGKNKDFLASDQAIAVPFVDEIFTFYYGRAIHTEALKRAIELYFSPAPELLPKGAGYSIITESRAIPICDRPDAILRLNFK